MGDSSPLSRRSSILFGIHSQSKAQQDLLRIRKQNKRFTLIAAAAIFILVLAMICLVILDLYTSASIIKRQNRTQSLTEQRIEHLGELIKTQQWKLVKDVELEPEESQQEVEERWDTVSEANNLLQSPEGTKNSGKFIINRTIEYANHRYSDDPDFGKPEHRIGWKPRPFSLKMDTAETERPVVNSIQDILGHSSEVHEKPALPPPGFSKPMRFRGVFLHPPSQVLPLHQNNYDRRGEYHKKINDFFMSDKKENEVNDNMGGGSDIQPTYLQPAELYTKAIYHPYNQNEPQVELRKQWTRRNRIPKRKPFTVMLDIYPMDKTEDPGVIPLVSAPTKPKSAIFVPIRPGEKFYEPIPTPVRYIPQFLMPKKRNKGERMLMKLNLFPKSAQRRTWTWFQKGDDTGGSSNAMEACAPKGVIGHNPFGKPITAKWKDKKGGLVHANFITLNKWEERKDEGILDPR